MQQEFIQYINKHQLIPLGSTTLLAVSGGIDSMSLCYLFMQSGFAFSIAHCNFGLRGEESDKDEQLVRQFAEKHNIQLFVKKFDTEQYARSNGISIQMAARNLRYQWFNELASEYNFEKIAIAHNSNDHAETFFVNLARGTGIKGLCGIRVENNKIIRPILFASRKQIETYVESQNIPFRNDLSNESIKYTRNRIRHKIMPEFELINPSFLLTMQQNMEHLQMANNIIQEQLEDIRHKVMTELDNGIIKIHIKQLTTLTHPRFWLFELLYPYGFTAEQIDEILQSTSKEAGKQFISSLYTLIKDREYLLLAKKKLPNLNRYQIPVNCKQITTPLTINFEGKEYNAEFTVDKHPSIAQLDFDKLQFPLELRTWKAGDSFVPLGMKGHKKLSDYFIDKKISLPEKDEQWLLISGNDIVWVVGQRIDERYKINQQTRRLFICSLG